MSTSILVCTVDLLHGGVWCWIWSQASSTSISSLKELETVGIWPGAMLVYSPSKQR